MTSWDGFEKTILDSIWEDILDNTNAPNIEACKRFCLDSIGDKWRQWKHRVKKEYYNTHNMDEERKKVLPPNVRPDDWIKLIGYFGRESVRSWSKKNKENRGRPVASNRSGRKSHDCIRHELKNAKKASHRVAVWTQSRRKKDGTFDENDGAKDLVEQLSTRMSELQEDENDDSELVDQVFIDVMGEDGHGRVRTMGLGITPSMMKSKAPSSSAYGSEIEKLRAEHDEKIWNLRAELREEARIEREQEREMVIIEVMRRMQNSKTSAEVL